MDDVCASQVIEIQSLKRSLAAVETELSDTKSVLKSKSLKPEREMANALLKSENVTLKRRCEILANLYVKLSDFVIDETGVSIGLGLFCHIDIYESDVGMYLLDFIGHSRDLTKSELNGRIMNKYLLTLGNGRVLDCKQTAVNDVCKASRCNQARGLRGSPSQNLEIVFLPKPHLKISASSFANSEMLTSYHGIV